MDFYKNTIRKMISSNQEIESLLYEDSSISRNGNKVANIELFFLTFKLFKEELNKIEILDKWKNLLNNGDYYIKGDKIYFDDQEVSFHLLEIVFIKILEQYKKNNKPKIIQMPIKDNKEETTNNIEIDKEDKIISLRDNITNADDYIEEAQKQIYSYKIDDSITYYLSNIRNNFKDIAFDSILLLYNKLKRYRKDEMFKDNIPHINEENINDNCYKDIIKFLLDFYAIQYYSKDKINMDYENMEMSNIEVDANHYRYDDEWTRLNDEYEELNQRINHLNTYKNRFRFMSPRDYKKLPFIIATLEMKRSQVLEELLELSFVRETELVSDDEYFDSYYSGELYNKHILYNLEVALNNGHIDLIKKHNKDMMVFYAIVDNEVDYILEVELDKIKDVIDTVCLKETIDKKVLTYC